MNFFNDLADFSSAEIRELITLARRLDEKPEPRALAGKVLSLLFLSPSLRTLISFQSAMIRMGGGTFVVSPEMSIHGLESRSGIVMDGAVTDSILDGPRSVVIAEARNRMLVQMAVLHRMLLGS